MVSSLNGVTRGSNFVGWVEAQAFIFAAQRIDIYAVNQNQITLISTR